MDMRAMDPSFPEYEDPWFGLVGTCRTIQGSISCQNEQIVDGVLMGTCLSNQGEDLVLRTNDVGWYSLGLVGAICTAEHTSFIPAKNCVENAHCVPDQGEGHMVGTCQCVTGFNMTEQRTCVDGGGVTEAPRTTTTKAPETPPEFKLPLDLLLNVRYGAGFGENCNAATILNRTYCNSHQGTVSCQERKCKCNMGDDDAIFDPTLKLCVGKVGSPCLSRRNLMGWKACTDGADCVVDGDAELYSFGKCECLYGYNAATDGTCTKDENIANPSTKKPGRNPTPPPNSTTTTTPPPRDGAATIGLEKIFLLLTFVSISHGLYSH